MVISQLLQTLPDGLAVGGVLFEVVQKSVDCRVESSAGCDPTRG